jgi:hypothetical protein
VTYIVHKLAALLVKVLKPLPLPLQLAEQLLQGREKRGSIELTGEVDKVSLVRGAEAFALLNRVGKVRGEVSGESADPNHPVSPLALALGCPFCVGSSPCVDEAGLEQLGDKS